MKCSSQWFIAIVLSVLVSCTQKKPAEVVIHNIPLNLLEEDRISSSPRRDNPYLITVNEEDTVYTLARANHVGTREIIDLNQLTPPYVLTPGQSLRLPKPTFHQIEKGDTLYSISRTYHVDISQLIRVNDIEAPYIIKTGSRLRLPMRLQLAESEPLPETLPDTTNRASHSAPKQRSVAVGSLPADESVKRTVTSNAGDANAPVPLMRKSSTQANIITAARAGSPTPSYKPLAASDTASKSYKTTYTPTSRNFIKSTTASDGFLKPVDGSVISRFGPKKGGLYNDGVNISAPEGTLVRAAEGGTVVYSGNELRGYGNLLLIKHSNGYLTAYAHNQKNKVAKGESVKKGDVIALVGKTGHVSSPQLHFSIRKGRKALDPEKFL